MEKEHSPNVLQLLYHRHRTFASLHTHAPLTRALHSDAQSPISYSYSFTRTHTLTGIAHMGRMSCNAFTFTASVNLRWGHDLTNATSENASSHQKQYSDHLDFPCSQRNLWHATWDGDSSRRQRVSVGGANKR